MHCGCCCPCCGGPGGFLGRLGRLLYYRCRDCGLQWSKEDAEEEEVEERAAA